MALFQTLYLFLLRVVMSSWYLAIYPWIDFTLYLPLYYVEPGDDPIASGFVSVKQVAVTRDPRPV